MEDSKTPSPSNAFMQIMQTHDGGEICNELAEAMRESVAAVGRTGKPASISLSVKFVPAAKGAYGVFFSRPKVKKADEERTSSLWFSDEDGNLHRNDPRQKELPLKTVADPQNEKVRKAG